MSVAMRNSKAVSVRGRPVDFADPVSAQAVASAANAGNRSVNVGGFPFLARGDNTTDDTAAIQAADAAAAAIGAVLDFPAGIYITTATINKSASWRGSGSGTVYNTDNAVKIKKINGNTNGNSVVSASAPNTFAKAISLIVGNFPDYSLATYPSGSPYTNNPDYGFYGNGQSALFFDRCSASGFRTAGISLNAACIVSQIEQGDYRCNGVGIQLDAMDCQIISVAVHHNFGNGINVTGNYARLINNRIEWNAGQGAYFTGGEFTVVGNLFDRNAKQGAAFNGGWGGTITGNYFSRNGCGGNGTVGRWAFSTLGQPSYVALTAGQSCHISFQFMRDVVISGNRYRSGLSDANDGANGPQYIFADLGSNDASIIFQRGAGEDSGTGYHSGYPGGGALQYGSFVSNYVSPKRQSNNGSGGSLSIATPGDGSYGSAVVQWSAFPNSGVTRVSWQISSVFGNTTKKEDLCGTGASSSLAVAVSGANVNITGYTFMSAIDIVSGVQ